MANNSGSRVLDRTIEEEMRSSFASYAMSVIVSRALPDVRDGLKPVHRRVLYAMHDLGLLPSRPYRKSATIVGESLGKYHPHGDSSVYETLVRLAQDFSMRHPLVDGQGNFGSVDGDPAAAQRYTEARMSSISTEMLADINRDTVDFEANFDESTREPVVLPARFPNLLVNGAEGIAVGMATRIPPHNLGEVCDAAAALVDSPNLTVPKLARLIQGPDFPTGGVIAGREGIEAAIRSGRGQITVRAVNHTEDVKGGKRQLVFTELPYQVNKAQLLQKIAALVKDKKVDGVSDLRDESDRSGMRMIVEVRRDARPKAVLESLYKQTALQSTYGINMVALAGGVPKTLSYKQALEHYVSHRLEVIERRTRHDLDRAEARAHIVEGLLKALDNLDRVVKIIRGSEDTRSAREELQKKLKLTERQAQAILDLRLQRLTALERGKLEEESRNLAEEIERLRGILDSEEERRRLLKADLREMKRLYASERRTAISEAAEVDPLGSTSGSAAGSAASTTENEAPASGSGAADAEEVAVSLSAGGYLRSIAISALTKGKRRDKGAVSADALDAALAKGTRKGDYLLSALLTSTGDNLLLFTSAGKLHRLSAAAAPRTGARGAGKKVSALLDKALGRGERVVAMTSERAGLDSERDVLVACASGTVKRTSISEYSDAGAGRDDGIQAIDLETGDEVTGVSLIGDSEDVVLASKAGSLLRFPASSIRSSGRGTGGVKGMTFRAAALAEGDRVVAIETAPGEGMDSSGQLSVVAASDSGYAKRTALSEYRSQKRGGTGVLTLRLASGESLAGVRIARTGYGASPYPTAIMLGCSADPQIIEASGIEERGRGVKGAKLSSLPSGATVLAVLPSPAEQALSGQGESPEADKKPAADEDSPKESKDSRGQRGNSSTKQPAKQQEGGPESRKRSGKNSKAADSGESNGARRSANRSAKRRSKQIPQQADTLF